MRFVLIRLLLILPPVAAQLFLESPVFAQQDGSSSQSVSALAKENWYRRNVISVRNDSISILVAPRGDELISNHTEELNSIEISLYREPFGSHHVYLTLGFGGKDLSKEIRLDADGEDLNLRLLIGMELSRSCRTIFSNQFELSQADYQRLVQAKTLAIKGGGSTFLLTGEHIKALKGFAEAGVGSLKYSVMKSVASQNSTNCVRPYEEFVVRPSGGKFVAFIYADLLTSA